MKIQLCHHINTFHFKIYSNSKQLFCADIKQFNFIFTFNVNISVFHLCVLQNECVRMVVHGQLKTLTYLDDVFVMEEEAAAAVQVAARSRINQVWTFWMLYSVFVSTFDLEHVCVFAGISDDPLSDWQWTSPQSEFALFCSPAHTDQPVSMETLARAWVRLDHQSMTYKLTFSHTNNM